MTDWHQQAVPDILTRLKSDAATGLTDEEARARSAELGPNELIETGGRGPWRILWEQLSGAMVLLLILAGHETTGVTGKNTRSLVGSVVM